MEFILKLIDFSCEFVLNLLEFSIDLFYELLFVIVQDLLTRLQQLFFIPIILCVLLTEVLEWLIHR